MNLTQILISHGAAVVVVTLLLFAGFFFDAGPSYRSVATLGLLPAIFLIVYVISIVPVVLARRWAARQGWNSYWHAIIAGASLGAVLYGGFVALLNGREIISEPAWAAIDLASGVGLGAAGGLAFVMVERRLSHEGAECTEWG